MIIRVPKSKRKPYYKLLKKYSNSFDEIINYLLKSSQCVVLSYVSYISIDTHHSYLRPYQLRPDCFKTGSSRKHFQYQNFCKNIKIIYIYISDF